MISTWAKYTIQSHIWQTWLDCPRSIRSHVVSGRLRIAADSLMYEVNCGGGNHDPQRNLALRKQDAATQALMQAIAFDNNNSIYN